jgi:hypothetical protein
LLWWLRAFVCKIYLQGTIKQLPGYARTSGNMVMGRKLRIKPYGIPYVLHQGSTARDLREKKCHNPSIYPQSTSQVLKTGLNTW